MASIKSDANAPLYSWDIFSQHLVDMAIKGDKYVDIECLQKFKDVHDWNIHLGEVLDKHYEALVLTDAGFRIQWVNDGFVKMTGYPKKEALGNSPRMLQGINTCDKTRERIRQKLSGNISFTEEVVNYRKTGEEYICRLEIHPIFDGSKDVRHYLALEYEL